MNSTSSNCIFCRIADGTAESSQVHADELCIAFLSLHQVNPGHTLVCPTRHVESFTDLEPAEASNLFAVAQRVARAQRKNLAGCSGVTLSLADGVAANQDVSHCHLHVIPRVQGDGFGWKHIGRRYGRAELDSIAELLRRDA